MNRFAKFLSLDAASVTDEDGFSLIELMVVIVIIGLLTTVVVINVMPSQDRAMVEKARADVRLIEQALDMYRMDALKYPAMEDGLDVLVHAKGGLRTEGYIRSLPKDPWGNEYQYLIPGEHGAIDVFSYGADGRLGGEGMNADIGNWE
ncbi:type II secretion system protein GspG [Kordiimonas sediminis]|uniref:Type II secretion system core protein G n=1 Tax=Kordiimonas sediminis TaxID=1735581 RepID=A0A919E5Y8_9PROT|nr:type II secretion system major pseudopilin GspG [Kordiimonas sediminis]GHF17300.1 type II secretion system protein GspG [Kordiimonas sediminis]